MDGRTHRLAALQVRHSLGFFFLLDQMVLSRPRSRGDKPGTEHGERAMGFAPSPHSEPFPAVLPAWKVGAWILAAQPSSQPGVPPPSPA